MVYVVWACGLHLCAVFALTISLSLSSGRLLVGTFVALFFNLLTLLSVRNKPFVYVSEGTTVSQQLGPQRNVLLAYNLDLTSVV